MKTVAIAIVAKEGQPDNIVAAETKEKAIFAAWMQSRPFEVDFETAKTGSSEYMEYEMKQEGHVLDVFTLPIFK